MAWQRVYQLTIAHSDLPVLIDYQFQTSPIIVTIESPRQPPEFHKAGLIWTLTDIDGLTQVRSNPLRVYFCTQKLDFELLENRPYTVQFLQWYYLTDIKLTFYHNPNISQHAQLDAIQVQLDRIEAKIDRELAMPPGSTYTQFDNSNSSAALGIF